ncbi:MAG: hypothetical protein R3C10_09750 [Pirellulales bacterium]
MGSIHRKKLTRPIPKKAEVVTVKGERIARWKTRRGGRTVTVTAPIAIGRDGIERISTETNTWMAKYRDGAGVIRERSTGCRDRDAALAKLAEFVREAEKVRSGVISADDLSIAESKRGLLAGHLDDYMASLRAADTTAGHRKTVRAYLDRLAEDCNWLRLSHLSRSTLERWLSTQAAEGRSARSRNGFREAAHAFGAWLVSVRRLAANPFVGVPKADQRADRRRQRRSLTTVELKRLLVAARLRPLAEYGRFTIAVDAAVKRGRQTWTKEPLTFATLPEAAERARERLVDNPSFVAELEMRGAQRSLVYKGLAVTGLRKAELASLTVGQPHSTRRRRTSRSTLPMKRTAKGRISCCDLTWRMTLGVGSMYFNGGRVMRRLCRSIGRLLVCLLIRRYWPCPRFALSTWTSRQPIFPNATNEAVRATCTASG